MKNYLPEAVSTATNLLNVDKGNVFSRRRTSEKRLEMQKEIYIAYLKCSEATSLAKIEAEKEIRKLEMTLAETMKNSEMDYLYKIKSLQLNAFIQLCDKFNFDIDDAKELFLKIL